MKSKVILLLVACLIASLNSQGQDIKNRSLTELFVGRKLNLSVVSASSGKAKDYSIPLLGEGYPDIQIEVSICNSGAEVKGIDLLCISKKTGVIKGSNRLLEKEIKESVSFTQDDVYLAISQQFFSLKDYKVKAKLIVVRKNFVDKTLAERIWPLDEVILQSTENRTGISLKVPGEEDSNFELKAQMEDGASVTPEIWKDRSLTDLLAHQLLKVEIKDLQDTSKSALPSTDEFYYEAEICTAKLYCFGKISYTFTIDPKTRNINSAHGLEVFFNSNDVPNYNRFLKISDYNFSVKLKKKFFGTWISSTIYQKQAPLDKVIVDAKKGQSVLSFPFNTESGLKGTFAIYPTSYFENIAPIAKPIRAPIDSKIDLNFVPKDIMARIQNGTPEQRMDLVKAYKIALKAMEISTPKLGQASPDYIAQASESQLRIQSVSAAIYQALTTATFQLPPAEDKDWAGCASGNTLAFVMVSYGSKMNAGNIILCQALTNRALNQSYSFKHPGINNQEEFFLNGYAGTLIHEAHHHGVAKFLNSQLSLNECAADFTRYTLTFFTGLQFPRSGYRCPTIVERWHSDPRFK